MTARWSQFRESFVAVVVLGSICIVAITLDSDPLPQAAQVKPTNPVQTGPIDEPRSAQHEPSGPPVPKGAQAISQQNAKCSTRLIVNADALFRPSRWTLNPDAAQTLDALAPMIVKAGKHPVRIESFVTSTAPERENQSVAERRAITVRGWLMNHGYVPVGTPVTGVGKHEEIASAGSDDSNQQHSTQRVEIVIDTCK
jgi:outer membrane protein OmpA-like peptidoglycan-associated protein